jgi:ethanolamine utilization microcompartment shell protein EutS
VVFLIASIARAVDVVRTSFLDRFSGYVVCSCS